MLAGRLERQLTLLYLLPGELLAGPGGPLHDVGEADAERDELPVVVSVHWPWDEAGQEETFPWNRRGQVQAGDRS